MLTDSTLPGSFGAEMHRQVQQLPRVGLWFLESEKPQCDPLIPAPLFGAYGWQSVEVHHLPHKGFRQAKHA
jgi:hypothetical protein